MNTCACTQVQKKCSFKINHPNQNPIALYVCFNKSFKPRSHIIIFSNIFLREKYFLVYFSLLITFAKVAFGIVKFCITYLSSVKWDADTTTDWAICPGSKGLFVLILEPGFGRRDKSPWRLLSRVAEPGQKVPHAKKYLRPAGFEPKNYCLAHGFLTNSPK